ncbi:ABC transporter ATP-binding protein [Pedobacter aquatilis]|uniref:ABC transporter ATP-binding protein n=1 Tax=Pedobacter aquatilis TaxID=351343 RepID=UPI00293182E5|nr:ABC transporter ATP-binding protein [Pedobacter aquatilis]
MIDNFKEKVKNFTTNLNLKLTLSLVWHAAKGWMILSIIMIITETALFLGSMYALKLLVDKLSKIDFTDKNAEGTIIRYVVIAASIAILYAISRAISAYITEVQASKVSQHIDEQIHLKAISLELSYFESPDYYDILSRAKEAGSERPNLVITTLLEITKNALSLIAIGSVIFTINWFLLPLLILFVIPTLIIRIFFSNRLNVWRIKHTPLERKSSYLSTLITADTAAKEIRAFDLGQYFNDLYRKIKFELYKEKLKISYKRTILEALTISLATTGFFACIANIAIGTVRGTTSVGDIVLFLVIFPQSFTIIQNISYGISILYHNSIFITSIFELLTIPTKLHAVDIKKALVINDNYKLELKNVSFNYPGTDQPTLKNVNISIPAGKIIAIVGLNGAGKSTLIKLLCNLYKPSSGSICLNGTDINELDSAVYRKQISPVFQDFSKYHMTVADNIKFGNIHEDVNQDEITSAAIKSGAHDFIEDFPEKYNTLMGRHFEDGKEISIGQWQKIAIARALYSKANFLIFDEATSALDALAEKELYTAFRERIDNRSAIIVSHRHSAIKHADYIYVLSGGQILQQGTDDELLNTPGDYSKLFARSVNNTTQN